MTSQIIAVDSASPASKTKIRPGDKLISINRKIINDVLDYKYYSYDAKLILELEDPFGKHKKVKIKKQAGEEIGLEFETYLMDKAHHCANKCVFCFVDQLPRGMRKTLYFKDDDARLSFLMGNYITLTNLSEQEISRIIDLKISPINVSVHSTNPELRNLLLGSSSGGAGLNTMRRFANAGIVMNCQIVCCPGLNDGDELHRSMQELAQMYPEVNSVSIVPVGLTKFRERLYELRPFNHTDAINTLERVESFAEICMKKYGTRIFFCADEIYLMAEREIPNDEYYEEYPQLENGVGMLRMLIGEFEDALNDMSAASSTPFSIATGVSAAPFLEKLLKMAKEKADNIDGRVYAIKNDFFGHTINVAGLITGGDLINQLKGRDLGKKLFIPKTMLRHGENAFLDDITLAELEAELEVRVVPVEQDGYKLAEAMFGTTSY